MEEAKKTAEMELDKIKKERDALRENVKADQVSVSTT